jgi:hypothetical protein
MKNIKILLTIITIGFISCEKEVVPPYVEVSEEIEDTTPWNDNYNDGGLLTGGGPDTTLNLQGTQWVLTKLVTAFSTEYPDDTITFVSQTQYTINGGAARSYQLSNIPASTNYELSLYYFAPFGGSHYSAQVGYYFIDDGAINNAEFEDIQNQSTTIRAWFEKL